MGRLQYAVLCSLDGYTADVDGRFDWAAPDEEQARLRLIDTRGFA